MQHTLDCLRPVPCVSNVTSFDGLSILDFPLVSLTFFFILVVSTKSSHWTHKTQDEDNPGKLVTLDTQDTGEIYKKYIRGHL
jgi:hypothetical protein